MQELLVRLAQLFTIAFAVSTMLVLGLSLTLRQLVAPLRNWRFVLAALAVNFVVVPAAALAISRLLSLPEDLRIGLLLVSCAAGAPLVPKLVQIAKGDAASGGALVTLLVVATILFLPAVLPLLLPSADIDPIAVAVPLVWQMLLPLGAGLLVRARYEEEALEYRPAIGVISNISLVVVILTSVGQNVPALLGLFGTGGILAMILIIVTAASAGWLSAVPARVERRVMALASGQRNLAAALVVASADFADRATVLTYVATGGLLMLAILLPLAGELSRRPRGAHLGGPTGGQVAHGR